MPADPVIQGKDDLSDRPPRVIRRRMRDLVAYEILDIELTQYGQLSRDEQGAIGGLSFFGGAFASTVVQLSSMDMDKSPVWPMARCWAIAAVSGFLTIFFAVRWWRASRKRPVLLAAMRSSPLDPKLPEAATTSDAAPAASAANPESP
jgi:hypothetical protein